MWEGALFRAPLILQDLSFSLGDRLGKRDGEGFLEIPLLRLAELGQALGEYPVGEKVQVEGLPDELRHVGADVLRLA
jgi:hypothetical protein